MKKAPPSKTLSRLLKPEALQQGDTVGLVCPASRPQSPAALARCVNIIEEMGFHARVGEHVLDIKGCMAGEDDQRLRDIMRFLTDDTVKAIFCLTGGYGSLRLLDSVDYSLFSMNPKIIVGSDDNAHLLLAIYARTGLITLYGPNLDQVTEKYAFDRLKQAVTTRTSLTPVTAADLSGNRIGGGKPYCPVAGSVSGALVGGNLTALTSLLGTAYFPDLQEGVLFLEDINERTDILDRWLTSLYLAKQLEKVQGVILGEFANCGSRGSYNLLSLEELFAHRLQELAKPSCFDMPLGQTSRCATVPIGVNVEFTAESGKLLFGEPHLC